MQRIKTEIGFNANSTYLLCIGRLVKDKGIVELVNVFTNLQQTNPSLRLILVGDFEESLDPLPTSTIHEIQNNNAIIHITWSNEVEYYMGLAHNFVFPSHREGFPNVLLQAALMKLPILCSRIHGNVDIVEHKKTGLLFNSNDENSLREQLEWALHHKEEFTTMVNNLYHNILTTYPREIIWNAIKLEYDKLTS
jgi:glycosyltransferase involved in cell wall biosynthesis